jgi:ketosteroid isomerase-like protein
MRIMSAKTWSTRLAVAVGACAIALAACGGQAGQSLGPEGGRVADPPGDVAGLRRDLEATVLENYALLELGNIDAFADRVAIDRPIMLFGVEPEDVIVGVAPSALFADRRLFAGHRLRMLSRNLDIHLSRDRSVGWVFDEVSYRVPFRGREASIPLRVTSVYTRDIDRWVLAMQHMSYALPLEEILEASPDGALGAPARFQTGYSVDGPATGLRRIAWRVISGEIGPHYRERRMAASADALVLWPGPRQEFAGASIRDAPTLAELFASAEGEPAEVEIGDHTIEVARNGEVAWMAANLAVFLPKKEGRNDDRGAEYRDSSTVELRATFVFEERADEGWTLVQTHASAAIPAQIIAERVFGTPNLVE